MGQSYLFFSPFSQRERIHKPRFSDDAWNSGAGIFDIKLLNGMEQTTPIAFHISFRYFTLDFREREKERLRYVCTGFTILHRSNNFNIEYFIVYERFGYFLAKKSPKKWIGSYFFSDVENYESGKKNAHINLKKIVGKYEAHHREEKYNSHRHIK